MTGSEAWFPSIGLAPFNHPETNPIISCPLRTSVIGSYSFPGWLEFASRNLELFGPADRAEAQDDAVTTALHDQLAAGLDVVTDGEQPS